MEARRHLALIVQKLQKMLTPEDLTRLQRYTELASALATLQEIRSAVSAATRGEPPEEWKSGGAAVRPASIWDSLPLCRVRGKICRISRVHVSAGRCPAR